MSLAVEGQQIPELAVETSTGHGVSPTLISLMYSNCLRDDFWQLGRTVQWLTLRWARHPNLCRRALEEVEIHEPARHSKIQVLHDNVAEELAPWQGASLLRASTFTQSKKPVAQTALCLCIHRGRGIRMMEL